MNIFYLDNDPKRCAQQTCDKHVVKMIVESAQLLSTAHHVLDGDVDGLYKPTHKNHPSAIWCRTTDSNYVWLWCLLVSLPTNIPNGDFTPPTPAMPDHYKTDDALQSYHNYYNGSKASFAKWTGRSVPSWFNG